MGKTIRLHQDCARSNDERPGSSAIEAGRIVVCCLDNIGILPLHRPVEARLGERIGLTGQILDISLSGAAIRLDDEALPFPGARVRVGMRLATVARSIEAGIAVAFAVPFASDTFDERACP